MSSFVCLLCVPIMFVRVCIYVYFCAHSILQIKYVIYSHATSIYILNLYQFIYLSLHPFLS